MDHISGVSSGGQHERVRSARAAQAQAEGTKATTSTGKKDGKSGFPSLDSKFLTNAAVGVLKLAFPDDSTAAATPEKTGKAGHREVSKGEKREKTAVGIGGTCITGGLALSECFPVGECLIAAGLFIDAVAIAAALKQGHGKVVIADAVASLVPVVGGYIKKVVEAA